MLITELRGMSDPNPDTRITAAAALDILERIAQLAEVDPSPRLVPDIPSANWLAELAESTSLPPAVVKPKKPKSLPQVMKPVRPAWSSSAGLEPEQSSTSASTAFESEDSAFSSSAVVAPSQTSSPVATEPMPPTASPPVVADAVFYSPLFRPQGWVKPTYMSRAARLLEQASKGPSQSGQSSQPAPFPSWRLHLARALRPVYRKYASPDGTPVDEEANERVDQDAVDDG